MGDPPRGQHNAQLPELEPPDHENIEGGHGGAADDKQSAFTYTFLRNSLGE